MSPLPPKLKFRDDVMLIAFFKTVNQRTNLFALFLVSLLLLLSACGGGGGTGTAAGPTQLTGVFVDSAVAGMAYSSGSITGITGADGTFLYEQGATVTFTIGDIVVGTGIGQAVMTPVSLVTGAVDETNPTVTNIVQFLLTLDEDGIPGNGIQISAAVSAAAIGQNIDFTLTDFDNNSTVVNAVALLTPLTSSGLRTLVSESVAQDHLNATLAGSGGANQGTLTLSGATIASDNGVFVMEKSFNISNTIYSWSSGPSSNTITLVQSNTLGTVSLDGPGTTVYACTCLATSINITDGTVTFTNIVLTDEPNNNSITINGTLVLP